MTYEKILMMGGVLMLSFCGSVVTNFLLDAGVEAQGPQAVTTSQVNLVDANGVLRATLSAQDERGVPSLTFYDPAGRGRGVFGIEETGTPFLRLLNPAGDERLSVRVNQDDALLIVGDDRRTHGVLASTSDVPVLSFADGRRSRAQLQIGESGSPSLIFFGADGQRSAAVTVDDSDTPTLTFYENSRPRITLGIVQEAAVLNMTGPAQSRLVIGVAGNGRPSVTFVNDAGEVVEELP
jgi:hypothetical protein